MGEHSKYWSTQPRSSSNRHFGDDSWCSPGIPARQCDEAEESPVVGAGAAEGDEGGRVLGQLGAAVVDQADLVLPETEQHPERERIHSKLGQPALELGSPLFDV